MHAFLNCNVLLVEDNEVNQSVALDQLERLGYTVEVASNGQEALDAMSVKNYEVVLMDCGMPVMDGYTTTAEIRKREGESRHTPIVAMTAHAMKGDREKCLAAGMDDYISKPVKRKILEGVLATLFGFEQPSGPLQIPAGLDTVTHFDRSIVDVACLSEAASSPEKLRHIIEIYLRHTETRLQALKAAVEQRSPREIYDIAHQSLGSSSTCGMTAIVPALRELQRMGKTGDITGAADQLNVARAAFEQIKPFLHQYLDQITKTGGDH
jgi:CheY-like chemotaxis protein